MTLSRRAALLIVPVLLAGYLLVALAVYYVERSSIERLEQARLNNQLTELRATFSVYSSFADSYLFAISESEALHRFLQETDDRYRKRALGGRLEDAFGNLTDSRSGYISFALIEPNGQPAYFFASSDNPFRDISAEELAFANSAFRDRSLSGISVVQLDSGSSLLIQHRLLDTRTLATPLPNHLQQSVVVQVAIELTTFDAQVRRLEDAYGTRVEYSQEARTDANGWGGNIRLLPDLYLRLQPDPRFIAEQLRSMQHSLSIGALLVCAISAGLLMWLIRRYITLPVHTLERQLNEVMHGMNDRIAYSGQDEIGRLARQFQQLYGQLDEAYRRSRQLAEQDSLTGLPNRNRFNELAVRELKLAAERQLPVGLLYIDLDHFKFVNDKYGHSVGDSLLKSFAHRASALIQHECNRSPRCGQAVLARLAGDEFAVLLYGYRDAGQPEHLANRLLGLVRDGYQFELGSYPVTLSIGIACCPEDGHNITQLISNADTAMYQAKHGGKNRVAFYSQELARKARRELEIEHQLKVIDFDRELYLTYMPILDAKGRIDGCEALLRWESPTLGRVTPDSFIPIAERTGLYGLIDRWVVQRSFTDLPRLRQILGSGMTLSINLSSAELTVPDFDLYLQEQLMRAGVEAGSIEVEMTETFGVESSVQRNEMLGRLRGLGLQIAIDDFGTGYTSMMQMVEYPVDKVKLDRSFIERLIEPANQRLLAPIISLCHARGLRVTAEGVETELQAKRLIAAGCDCLQGYLFGRPMRLEELESWIVERMAVKNDTGQAVK
ncbi:EAL domain-containing protein [Marinobacterium sp. D7]|uniref:putative bifunctional diguanylate cyclase/phosphodiesterase n=1 Tax=Marinobacterium ramblicola TaxID=2849041 RepID=UPI001C2DCD32|nr:EAL domain-containing protein [Marinobacterium ramblicola]MBV1790641.1 EAL domain-containing protein [Marinobacterium ramblicola]